MVIGHVQCGRERHWDVLVYFPGKGHCSLYVGSPVLSHKFGRILLDYLGHQGSGTEQLYVHLSLRFLIHSPTASYCLDHRILR